MKIRVFTDLRFSASQTPTGVGKHICEMVRGLDANPANEISLLTAKDQVDADGKIPIGNTFAGMPNRVLPLPWKVADGLWTATGMPCADRWCGKADWVYCPKNDFIPIRGIKTAFTVHGASELDPDMPMGKTLAERVNRWRRRTAYLRMVKQATAILTVSDFLKSQVVEWFGAEESRVHVVGNGVEQVYFDAAHLPIGASGQSADSPYVLAIGGLNHLDGGDRVLAVAELLGREMPDMRILIAGAQHDANLLEKAKGLPNLTLLGFTDKAVLAKLLRDAVALLFPTRYETFGIAAAEAMAVGTPVITCRSTAVPEIVGEAGIYTDPDKPNEVVEAIRALSSKTELYSHYSEMGHKRAASYTWQACVDRLQQVFDGN